MLQSIDHGSHSPVNQKTTSLGQRVNMIVIVQFKYVKMFCYYIVSVTLLDSLGNFLYVYDAEFSEGHLPRSR